MGLTYTSREKALEVVADKVEDVDVVLDLGPGICPQHFVKPYVHICVDAHRPYLEHLSAELSGDPKYILINGPWDQVIGMLPDKSVDSVFALDFIEHLEKQDGLRMLREAERVARRQIVVYTPHGFFPQTYDDPGKRDRWGMDGGFWQTHRSGWEPEDFGEDWDFVSCPDFILLNEDNQMMEEPMGAIWAFRNLNSAAKRRYMVLNDGSLWPRFKKALKKNLPTPAYNLAGATWRILARAIPRRQPLAKGPSAYGGHST